MMIKIAYSEDIKSGKLQIPDNENIQIIADKFFEYDFPIYRKILAKFGSPQFGMTGNLMYTGGKVVIGWVSAIKYFKIKNIKQKFFHK